MRPLLRRVPQLQRLAVFDAVATSGGFTSAARELGISQPAVSRHIATIERQLGITLVERSGGQTELTEQGRRLADGIAGAFAGLERALDDVTSMGDSLVFAVQPTMATSWIVPALEDLESLTGSAIRLRIFDRRSELDAGDWDLAVVPGPAGWGNSASVRLFAESVRPLASPGFAAEHDLDADTPSERLLGVNLLYIDADERPSMTWSDWFGATSASAAPPTPRVVFDSYPTVLQEAIVGHGVVLGWRHLVGDLVERALLVPVGPVVTRDEIGHHLCWRHHGDDPRFAAIADELAARLAVADAMQRPAPS